MVAQSITCRDFKKEKLCLHQLINTKSELKIMIKADSQLGVIEFFGPI